MNLDKLEKQVIVWSRLALLVPVAVSGILAILYFYDFWNMQTLFYIACGLYFTTAVVWWWWTMKTIHYLIKIMKNANTDIQEVGVELRSIRKELQVDNSNTK
jgi:hypothetical protein